MRNIPRIQTRSRLRSGTRVSYDFLIVAPGLELDWDAIPGLREAVGNGSVSTNYTSTMRRRPGI